MRDRWPRLSLAQSMMLGVAALSAGMGPVEVAIAAPLPEPFQVCPTRLGQANFPILSCTKTPSPRSLVSQDQRLKPILATELAESTEGIPSDLAVPVLELDPSLIEQSPVLQRWLRDIPDVADEIRNQPAFRTRLRLGYVQFPSTGNIGGIQAAIEDVFIFPDSGLTASGDYSGSVNGQRASYGLEARYYLLPLGGYVNLAPTVGYRSLSTSTYSTDGWDVGLRLMLIPSPGGAADLAISQRWVAPGSVDEVGITGFTLGYAVTRQLRLGSQLQFQNSRFRQDSSWGLSLEWLL